MRHFSYLVALLNILCTAIAVDQSSPLWATLFGGFALVWIADGICAAIYGKDKPKI